MIHHDLCVEDVKTCTFFVKDQYSEKTTYVFTILLFAARTSAVYNVISLYNSLISWLQVLENKHFCIEQFEYIPYI